MIIKLPGNTIIILSYLTYLIYFLAALKRSIKIILHDVFFTSNTLDLQNV